MKSPVNVAITGAAGQIGYALAFRVASGQMLGADQPINLHLLEITPALNSLQGVVMELNDCAFATLNKIVATDDAKVAFKDCNVAMLVGARPRGPGMERKDLLIANAQIFSAQGKALDAVADRNVRVLVVGNPANTNSLIAQRNAPKLNPRNFTAMVRLDHNRALAQLAEKAGSHVTQIPQDDDLGQSLLDTVSRSASDHGGWQTRLIARRSELVCRDLHSGCAAARRCHYQGARCIFRCFCSFIRNRSRARLGEGNCRWRLDQHGRALGRQLWNSRRRHLRLSGHL